MTPYVRLIHWTGTLFPAYLAARGCRTPNVYKLILDEGIPTEQEMTTFLARAILHQKPVPHLGIFEHLTFTFYVGEVSRIMTHQLVRHRIASYAQLSQRAVEPSEFVIPPSMKSNAYAIQHALEPLLTLVDDLRAEGIPTEDLRFLFPHGGKTWFTMTMNGRALIESSKLRLCSKAQWEVRGLFHEFAAIVQEICPLVGNQLFPDCMSCDGSCEHKES